MMSSLPLASPGYSTSISARGSIPDAKYFAVARQRCLSRALKRTSPSSGILFSGIRPSASSHFLKYWPMPVSSTPPFRVSSLDLAVQSIQEWGVSSLGTEPLLDRGARRLCRLTMTTCSRVY